MPIREDIDTVQSPKAYPPEVQASTPTLAAKLGRTCHFSPLLQKLKRLGASTPRRIASLAISRGCRHYAAYQEAGGSDSHPSRATISDEEVAVALLSPANPYDPMLIRIGSQMLSGLRCDPRKLVRLAVAERCEPVLKYIAECGTNTEPDVLFWKQLLECLPECNPIPAGVMPHPSRFRIECGILNPLSGNTQKIQWLRPVPP